MKQRYDINPNTIERMEEFYSQSKMSPEKERINEWMYPYLQPLIPLRGKVLDVGCGMGKTLEWINSKNKNLELIGHDISTVAIKKAISFYPEFKFEIKDSSNWDSENEFDLIINSQTLEHVDDPVKIILNMKKALKVGGTLFITVPYPGSSLDRGVKLHHWTFFPSDFIKLLGDINSVKEGKNHLIIIWRKK